ncbi:hypothetical protein FHQ18_05725 [Deferribacter autotrophicus]|uniref:Lipoprotein n=1 Tax=Deferribacter autotrophicus TaxID=500465 RepID=A0A5A8F3E2_9BACT|nr:hypothetical protein [Deferribacter autotrophicus]KAA0258655.1 hypothetical protein FHQ18_05725 [Deferribacter autotrophicus]
MKTKTCFLVIVIFVLISCVQKENTIRLLRDKPVKTVFIEDIKEDSPTEFEKALPKSTIIKNSIVVFKKVYPKKLLANNVVDFDKGVILTDNFLINLNGINCKMFSLPDERIAHIYVSNRIVMLKGEKNFYFLDLDKCGQIAKMKAEQVIGFDGTNLYFQKNNTLLKKNIFTKAVVKLFDVNEIVERIENVDSYLFVLTKQGNLFVKIKNNGSYVDIAKFTKVNDFNLQKSPEGIQLYFKSDNKFFTFNLGRQGVNKTVEKVINGETIYLVKGKIGYFEDKFLFINDKKFLLDDNYERLIFYNGTLYGILKNALYEIDISKRIYRKSLILAPLKIKGCLADGKIYIKDLDGIIRALDMTADIYKIVDEIPENCEDLPYRCGKFILNAGEIVFAKMVNNDKNYLMLKRKIGDDIYYFFEKY